MDRGDEIALHYLEKIDNELERRCEALEESNERKLDLIHFLRKAIKEANKTNEDYQSQLKDYHDRKARKSPSRRAEQKQGTGKVVKAAGDDRDNDDLPGHAETREKRDVGDAKGGNDEGGVRTSLDDILAKARDLRQSKANQVPQPPFGSRQGTKTSSNSKSMASVPKKAASKMVASRRPLHESKFTPKRGTNSSSSVTSGGAKSTSNAKSGTGKSSLPSPVLPPEAPGGGVRSPSSTLSPSRRSESKSKVWDADREKEVQQQQLAREEHTPPVFKHGPLTTHLLQQVRPLLDEAELALYYEDGTVNETAVEIANTRPRAEEYTAEACKLTELLGRPSLPPSMAMDFAMSLSDSEQRPWGAPDVERNEDEDEGEDNVDWEEELPAALEQLQRIGALLEETRGEYERKWKLKLGRMKERGGEGSGDRSAELAKLPMSEREALFSLWYAMRRAFELYADTQDRVDTLLLCMARDKGITETPDGYPMPTLPRAVRVLRQVEERRREENPPRIWEHRLYEDLIESLPDRTPFSRMREVAHVMEGEDSHNSGCGGGDGGKQTKKQHTYGGGGPATPQGHAKARMQERLGHVKNFHAEVQRRVHYVAEAIIGRHVLKDLVKEMRYCCEREVPQARWVEALKRYKMLYTMLVDRCEVGNSVKFFAKTEEYDEV